MAAMSPVSRAPNTRPITASSVSRCRIVEAFTSTIGFAKPMMNTAANAAPTCGHAAARSSGTAQNTTPQPKSVASRRAVARPIATRPPMIAPTPSMLSR